MKTIEQAFVDDKVSLNRAYYEVATRTMQGTETLPDAAWSEIGQRCEVMSSVDEIRATFNRKRKQRGNVVNIRRPLEDQIEAMELEPSHDTSCPINEVEYAEYLKSEHWRGEDGVKWKRVEIDECRCRLCNSETTTVHHRRYVDCDGRSVLYRETMSDLTTVCDQCHELFHKFRTVSHRHVE